MGMRNAEPHYAQNRKIHQDTNLSIPTGKTSSVLIKRIPDSHASECFLAKFVCTDEKLFIIILIFAFRIFPYFSVLWTATDDLPEIFSLKIMIKHYCQRRHDNYVYEQWAMSWIHCVLRLEYIDKNQTSILPFITSFQIPNWYIQFQNVYAFTNAYRKWMRIRMKIGKVIILRVLC